jgi:hypothetical protein
MRALLVLTAVLLVSASCATLNTAGMSEPCRTLYNLCLNNCPSAAPPPPGQDPSTQIEVASCVAGCNERSKACR